MPYIFITSYIPNDKVNEAAKLHLETIRDFRKSIRGLSKEIIPNAVKPRKEYIEVVGVHDIKEGNLEKFLLLQAKDMTHFNKIEGYRYTIEVRFKLSEALEMIGLKSIEPD